MTLAAYFSAREVADDNGVIVGAYPWPISRLRSHTCGVLFEWLLILGLWDMPDRDFYVRGRWNWCFWRHPWARKYPEQATAGDRWPLAVHRLLLRQCATHHSWPR